MPLARLARFGAAMLALTVVLVVGAALLAGIANSAAAPRVQICFAIDGSGSISDPEFDLEKEGFASGIETSSITPQDGSIEVTVIAFATGAATVVLPTVIDGPVTAATVAQNVRNIDRSAIGIGSLTDIAEAIDLCTSNITGSAKFTGAGTQAINIATNGQPTTGGDPIAARNAALAAGIDRIDAEAVQGANVALLLDLVWPQPGEKVTPPDAPSGNTGFVLNVDSFDDFEAAIAAKIPAIIPDTPTPTVTETPKPPSTNTPTPTFTPIPSVTPIPTLTPFVFDNEPIAVGGLVSDLNPPRSGTNDGLVAGGMAAAAAVFVMLGGAAWYARMRR